MKNIRTSPLGSKLKDFLIVKDWFKTKKTFALKVDEFGMLVTTPRPDIDDIGGYYKSKKYISHSDSKSGFFGKIYSKAQSINSNYKINIIGGYKKEGSLLDFGCGVGDFLLSCDKNKWDLSGVEISAKAAKIAGKKNRISIELDLLKYKKNSFDCITLWHSLEHVYDLKKNIKKLKSMLKDDGVMFVAVPNYKSFDANYYAEFWAGYDTPRHLWHFSRESIGVLFEREGLVVIEQKPLWFDSVYVSLLSEKYKKSGFFGRIRAFFVGLYSNVSGIVTQEYSSVVYVVKKIK